MNQDHEGTIFRDNRANLRPVSLRRATRSPKRAVEPIDVDTQIAILLAQHRATQEAARAARRRIEAERRAAERARVSLFQDWMRARALLHAAVDEIEAVLAPVALYLSVTDDIPHPGDLAAVEIRLCSLGHPCNEILDLVVQGKGRQIVRTIGEPGSPYYSELPSIARVSVDDYRAELLNYVGRTLRSLADLGDISTLVAGSGAR